MRKKLLKTNSKELSRIIPVFPLTGVLLLPRGQLPLNIFEPRYLAMVRDVLKDEQRLIGMIQPKSPNPDDNRGISLAETQKPELYKTGCAGRITSFSESEDGRYMLTLTGICRFYIAEEMPEKDGYRRVFANYSRFISDVENLDDANIDREKLLEIVKRFFERQNIEASWTAIKATPTEKLVTSLAMSCPFGATERQALIETPNFTDRAQMLLTLLEMALLAPSDLSDKSH